MLDGKFNRRAFVGLAGAMAAFPKAAMTQAAAIPFYDAVGPELTVYGLNPGTGTLAERSRVKLPSNVQYCWPHPSRKFLYVASSNGQPGPPGGGAGAPGDNHFLSAFAVDPESGTLTPHGAPKTLTVRPIHMSVDQSGRYVLTAYNAPSHVTVHALNGDGTLGEEIPQASGLDFGIYAHQVRVTPGNRTVTLVTRGNNPTAATKEDPGAIKVFGFAGGKLSNLQSIQPAGSGGYGFGPRHLDFHPTLPFVYVSLERNNRLDVYRLNQDGSISAEALFKASTLSDPNVRASGPSGIHVHPNGRFVYVPNRGSGTVDFNGRKVSNGGYNSVAVFSIDQKNGEPRLIQEAEAHGFELRTFIIDPSGTMLIAASQMPMLVRDGDKLSNVAAGLSIYRIGSDGKLSFLRKQDIDTGAGTNFWCGLLTMV